MPRENNPTREDWENKKAELEHLYLVLDLTCEEVQQIQLGRGFTATIRQYKVKWKSWGFDDKKITGEVWTAMNVVKQARTHRCAFRVPLKNGNEIKIVTFEQITKQMKRMKKSAMDLRAAEHFLNSRNITEIEHGEASNTSSGQNSLSTVLVRSPPKLSSDSSPASSLAISDSERTVLRSDGITTFSKAPGWTARSGFSRAALTTGEPPRSWASVSWPSIDDMLDDLDQSIVPALPAIQSPADPHPRIGLPLVGRKHGGRDLTAIDDDFDPASAFAQLAFDSTSHTVLKDGSQPLSGSRPAARRQSLFNDDEGKLASRCASYYVMQSHMEFETLDDQLDPDRIEAMSNFRTMLGQCNRYIYPFLNWMSTVLGSNEKPQQLRAFLQDCCKVIDESATDYSSTYGTPFHFALALHLNDEANAERYGANFYHTNKVIGMIWGENSPNYLVNQYQYAWYQLKNKRHHEVLRILQDSLPKSEATMGPCHVVTINCLAILSRTYAELGKPDLAIVHLEDALNRDPDPVKPFQAHRHRLLRRLAELQIQVGNYQSAERNLRAVMEFRVEKWGLDTRTTWNAIQILCDLIESQGRPAESQHLWAHMRDRFDEEKKNTYLRFYGEQPSWVCERCNRPRASEQCCSAASSSRS